MYFYIAKKEKQFIWLPHNMRKGVNKMSHWNKSKKAFLLKCHCGQHSLVGHNSDFSFSMYLPTFNMFELDNVFTLVCALTLLDGIEIGSFTI